MHARRATAGIVVVLALLATSACDDEPEPKFADPTETPTTTEPSTPTPSVPVEPDFPDAGRALTKIGAIAFVEHFFQVVNYSQATGDVAPLVGLAMPTCKSCKAGSDGISEIYQAGGRIEGSRYATRNAVATPLRAGRLRLMEVRLLARSERGRAVGAGELDRPYPAGEDRYRFTLVQRDRMWRVLGVET